MVWPLFICFSKSSVSLYLAFCLTSQLSAHIFLVSRNACRASAAIISSPTAPLMLVFASLSVPRAFNGLALPNRAKSRYRNGFGDAGS
ncbi:hypothetical protein BKA65DRAFT_506385 [Rhexocercosporidium sp. MPI-PUGE-AT-0058]|nr:hypothetical protein BKA65DRAFT_506385 [Rhexocercosporidium sp. MPI-PUGE-AT-0058]